MAQQVRHYRSSTHQLDFSRLDPRKRTWLDKALDWAGIVWTVVRLAAAAVLSIVFFGYVGTVGMNFFGVSTYAQMPHSIYATWLLMSGVGTFLIGAVFFWGEIFPQKSKTRRSR